MIDSTGVVSDEFLCQASRLAKQDQLVDVKYWIRQSIKQRCPFAQSISSQSHWPVGQLQDCKILG